MSSLEKLAQRVGADARDPAIGELSNDLLREFQTGRNVDDLRFLLRCDDPAVVESGIWIASELGKISRPLLADEVVLLLHPSKNVRFLAIDCILSASLTEDSAALVSVLPLLDDADPSVRWKATEFLFRMTKDQLHSVITYLCQHNPSSVYLEKLRELQRD